MLNFKRIMPAAFLFAVFLFHQTVLAGGGGSNPENFDPNPATIINSQNVTDFKWNGSGAYNQLPLSYFNLCFEYVSPGAANTDVFACTKTSPPMLFQNHLAMNQDAWEKITAKLQNDLDFQGVTKVFTPGSAVPLHWFVQGVYGNGTQQVVVQSQPWAFQLQM